jgi:hypothetical protein
VHFFHGKSVTCWRQAVPLALSSFEWTPSSLPRLGLTGQAIPIIIRRDTSSSSSSILLFEREWGRLAPAAASGGRVCLCYSSVRVWQRVQQGQNPCGSWQESNTGQHSKNIVKFLTL